MSSFFPFFLGHFHQLINMILLLLFRRSFFWPYLPQLAPHFFAILRGKSPRKSCNPLLSPILFYHGLLSPFQSDCFSFTPLSLLLPSSLMTSILLNPMTFHTNWHWKYFLLSGYHCLLVLLQTRWLLLLSLFWMFLLFSLTPEHWTAQRSVLGSVLFSTHSHYLVSTYGLRALNATHSYDFLMYMSSSVLPESLDSSIQTDHSPFLFWCQLYFELTCPKLNSSFSPQSSSTDWPQTLT